MKDDLLKWTTLETRQLLHTPVFEVLAREELSAAGPRGTYVAMEAPDWVMVIPEWEDSFVLVRQWRHAAERITVEFPGGVRDGDEDPAETARRELEEETGFRAGTLIPLGSCSPNPALFCNTFHCYLARDLIQTGSVHPDADEVLRWESRPIRQVLADFGSPELSHGLMGTALAFYFQHKEGLKP